MEVNLERWAEKTLEQQAEQRPTMEEARPSPQDKGVDPTTDLGAWAGIVDSKNCTGRPNGKYSCVVVTLLSCLSFFAD